MGTRSPKVLLLYNTYLMDVFLIFTIRFPFLKIGSFPKYYKVRNVVLKRIKIISFKMVIPSSFSKPLIKHGLLADI